MTQNPKPRNGGTQNDQKAIQIHRRQIQRVELGESEAGNLTAKNLIAIADALDVDIRNLI